MSLAYSGGTVMGRGIGSEVWRATRAARESASLGT